MSSRWLLFDRDGFRCNYCGRSPLNNTEVILIPDHIIPQSLGGQDTMANLITSCEKCNLGKADRISENIDELIELARRRNSEKGISPSIPIKIAYGRQA